MKKIVPAYGYPDYGVTENGEIIGKRGHVMVGSTNGGYHRVTLRKNRKSHNVNVGRLVYMSYTDQIIPEGKEIDHINGDKLDNRVCNLACVTHSENMNNPITLRKLSKPKMYHKKKYDWKS